MSNTRDTFNDAKNNKVVIQQLDVPLTDSEFNEAQKNALSGIVEGMHAAGHGTNSVTPSQMRFPLCVGDGFQVQSTGSNDLIVNAGSCFVDGMRLVLGTSQGLVATGITFPLPGGTARFGYVYIDVLMTEIDSTQDPVIATPLVGETSKRLRAAVAFRTVESTVSFAAAIAGLAPIAAGTTVWQGSTARVFLCRYYRSAADTVFDFPNVVDMREPVPGELANSRVLFKTLRANGTAEEGTGENDGATIWDANNGRLWVGTASSTATIMSVRNGIRLSPTGHDAKVVPNHFVASTPQNVRDIASGVDIVPSYSYGIALANGQSWGYRPVVGGSFFRKGNAGGPAEIAAVLPVPPAYTPSPIIVQTLVVTTTSTFESDPAAFVIVSRVGNDLVWCNGDITRGRKSTNFGTSFGAPGDNPVPYDAVLSSTGEEPCHLSRTDALERALNFSASEAGTGTWGTGRNRSFKLRAGLYDFVRRYHVYGTTGEVTAVTAGIGLDRTNAGSIVVHGESPMTTELSFYNPVSAGRSSQYVAEFRAAYLEFKNVAFTQVVSTDSSHFSYVLLQGQHVVIENCVINAPLYVKATRVTIKNCLIRCPTSGTHWGSVFSASNPVAAGIWLEPLGATEVEGNWEVSHNIVRMAATTGAYAGVSVVLTDPLAEQYAINFHHNTVHYAPTAESLPALHLKGLYGDVHIHHNRFAGAAGASKDGNDSNVTAVPFGTDFSGAPYTGTRHLTTAYISCTTGRGLTSSTKIDHNQFDLSNVGNGASARYAMWGAALFMGSNSSNAYTSSSTIVANVSYDDNKHDMALVTPSWATGAWSPGNNPRPATWGFYMAPTFQSASLISSFRAININAKRNTFHIGGATGGGSKAWRSIRSMNLQSWPAGGVGYLTDTSCLIGLCLRNIIVSGTPHTGRWAQGVHFDDNDIVSQIEVGGFAEDEVALNDTTTFPAFGFTPIMLDAGHVPTHTGAGAAAGLIAGEDVSVPLYTPIAATATAVTPAGAGSVSFSSVCRNTISSLFYTASVSGMGQGTQVILLAGCLRTRVHENTVFMGLGATHRFKGIESLGSKRCLMEDNNVLAYVGLSGTTADCASDNHVIGCVTPFVTLTTAQTANNFS